MQSRIQSLAKTSLFTNNDLEPGVGWSRGREKPRGMQAAAVGQTSEGRAGRQAGSQAGRQAVRQVGRQGSETRADGWIDPGTEEGQVSARK